jgi:hypothetical protein
MKRMPMLYTRPINWAKDVCDLWVLIFGLVV